MLGADYDSFIRCYDLPPVRGIRINTLKISKDDFCRLSPWRTRQADTLDEGLILCDDVEHIGTHPYHIAGLFYVQEPSAMSVIQAADIKPGQRVLDLCAAPGGKSGGIAARLMGEGVLVSNEIVPSRARLLAQTIERLGAVNTVVTSAHPDAIVSALPCYFDRVIVDAPCSGEGMFRKDKTAISEWSPEHVKSCAVRQRAIIESASVCVNAGGRLIYSTCTFSQEENECVISEFLGEHSEFSLDFMRRLYPHTTDGEGHFVARLTKSSSACATRAVMPKPTAKRNASTSNAVRLSRLSDSKAVAIIDAFMESTFILSNGNGELSEVNTHLLSAADGRVLYAPFDLDPSIHNLRIVSYGTEMGIITKGRFAPAHSLFMSAFPYGFKNAIDLAADDCGIRKFLAGNTLDVPKELAAYVPVRADGYTVGFGKAVDGTLKNHLPKGLMIAAYR